MAQENGVILYQTGSLQVCENGPMIAYGKIDYHSDDRKEQIAGYWSKRSGFSGAEETGASQFSGGPLSGDPAKHLPGKKQLKILDVGCGTGFFSILLAREGYEVTGIDLTPGMIRGAEELAAEELSAEERSRCSFQVMDAENPEFSDGTFDVLVTRNLTWTLPDAEKAYREWSRVLKEDGVLLNFDADYGKEDCTDSRACPESRAPQTWGEKCWRSASG